MITERKRQMARMFATALVSAAAAGMTLAGCRGSAITGPTTDNEPRLSANLVGSGDGLTSDDGLISGDGELDENGFVLGIPVLPSLKLEKDPMVLATDPDFQTATHTNFPFTQAIYNTCMNELVVVNGHIVVHEKLKFDGLTLRYESRSYMDAREAQVTGFEEYDDDGDPTTPMKTRTVNYNNNEHNVDELRVGPAALPFQSRQEKRIWLVRQGEGQDIGTREVRKEPTAQVGDDMFVFVSQRFEINQKGEIKRDAFTFRAECR